MPNQWIRVNLAAPIFPFATQLSGRTIIVPQEDENYDRYNAASITIDKGVPQVYYMEDIMPETASSFQSVGYQQVFGPSTIDDSDDFDQAFSIQNASLNRFVFVPSNGKNYIYDATAGAWTTVPFSGIVGTPVPGSVVTVATVNEQSYICYAGFGIFIYDEINNTFALQVPTGIDIIQNVLGITAANGYLIVYSASGVQWSSFTNSLDFVPDVATGAGGGGINEAKGKIVCCLPIPGGFMVYCDRNVVSAQYSGNAEIPYNFYPVPNSSGVLGPRQLSWQENFQQHIAWLNSGITQVPIQGAASIPFPEASDFLSNDLYETFDRTTNLLTSVYLPQGVQLNVQCAAAGERFIVFSYGIPPASGQPVPISPDYSYALVYDLAYARWGKLAIEHRDCFELATPSTYNVITYQDLLNTEFPPDPQITYTDLLAENQRSYASLTVGTNNNTGVRKDFGFLQKDGTVKIVDFSFSEANAYGVLLLGKYQLQRNYFMTHLSTDIESIDEGLVCNVNIILTLDGKTFLPPVPAFLQKTGNKVRRYLKRLSGQNYSILVTGQFNATSILTNIVMGGKR